MFKVIGLSVVFLFFYSVTTFVYTYVFLNHVLQPGDLNIELNIALLLY